MMRSPASSATAVIAVDQAPVPDEDECHIGPLGRGAHHLAVVLHALAVAALAAKAGRVDSQAEAALAALGSRGASMASRGWF